MDRRIGNIELPQGVFVNASNGREPCVSVRFTLHGVEQKKTNPLWKVGKLVDGAFASKKDEKLTSASIGAAALTLARVQARIHDESEGRGQFVMADFFPSSRRERAPAEMLMGEIFDAYERGLTNTVKAQTRAKKLQHLNCWVRPQWAGKPISAVTVTAVREWVEAIRDGMVLPVLKNAKRNARPAGLLIRKGTMKQILVPFYGAIESTEGRKAFGEANPFKGAIKLADLWGSGNGSRAGYEVRPFTAEERAAIVAVASPQWARMLTFWWATGLRVSELLALKWDKVSLADETVLVHRQFSGGQLTESLKTKKSKRPVPLSEAALRALREQKAEAVQGLQGFVWTNSLGQPYTRSESIHDTWAALLNKAGVEYRNPEQSRHTFASALIAAGYDVVSLSKILGHEDSVTTHKYYARFIRDASTKHGFKPLPKDDRGLAGEQQTA